MNKNSRVNLVIVATLQFKLHCGQGKKEISLFNIQLRLVTVCAF